MGDRSGGPNAVDFIINYAEISIALVHTSKMKSERAFIQKVVNGTILRDEKRCRWINAAGIDYESPYMSFIDLQFPNGQLTYVAGESLTTSAFLPVCSGLLQAQSRYPGETKFSFSYKNKQGTHVTPMVQWPDKSFSLRIAHAMA